MDNTNPTAAERARYIEPARSGVFRVAGYYFYSLAKEALVRLNRRTRKACVPEKGIFGTQKRLCPPCFEEGFDEIYYVSIDEAGRLVVEELLDEYGR